MLKKELATEIEEKIERNNAIFGVLGVMFYALWLVGLFLFFSTGKAKALGLVIWSPLVHFPLNVLYCFAVILAAMIILVVVSVPPIWLMEKREERFLKELIEIS